MSLHCKNCGAKLSKNAKFCPQCGATVEDAAPSSERSSQESGKKGSPSRFIGIVIAAVVVVAVVIIALVPKNKTMSLMDYVSVAFSGLDGRGYAEVNFNENAFYADAFPQNDLSDDQRQQVNNLLSGVDQHLVFSGDGALSNGDDFLVSCSIESDYLSDYKIQLKDETYTCSVSGLIEAQIFNLSDYVNLSFWGYDGYGYMENEMQYDALYSDLSDAILAFDSSESAKEYVDYELWDMIYWDLPYFTMPENGYLSNGDALQLEWHFPEETPLLDSYGIAFEAEDIDLVVEGLQEQEEIDLMDYISVEFYGVIPQVYLEVTVDDMFDGINYLGSYWRDSIPYQIEADNGDTYELTIEYDEEQMLRNGYRVTNNTKSYEIAGLDTYDFTMNSVDDVSLQPFIEQGKENAAEYMVDNFSSEEGDVLWGRSKFALSQIVKLYAAESTKDINVAAFVYEAALTELLPDKNSVESRVYAVQLYTNVSESPDGALAYEDEDLAGCFYSENEVENYLTGLVNVEEGYIYLDNAADLIRTEVTNGSVEEELYTEPYTANVYTEAEIPESAKENTRPMTDESLITDSSYISILDSAETSYGAQYSDAFKFNANSEGWAEYLLDGKYAYLSGDLAVSGGTDSDVSMDFIVFGDGELLYSSFGLDRLTDVQSFAIDISGVRKLFVCTRNTGNYGTAEIVLGNGKLYYAENAEPALKYEFSELGSIDYVNCDYCPDLLLDSSGNLHEDYYDFNAGEEQSYRVKYLEGKYSEFSGTLVAGNDNSVKSRIKVQIFGDNELLYEIEDLSLLSEPVDFTIDVTGIEVLDIRAERMSEEGKAHVYLTDAILVLTEQEGETAAKTETIDASVLTNGLPLSSLGDDLISESNFSYSEDSDKFVCSVSWDSSNAWAAYDLDGQYSVLGGTVVFKSQYGVASDFDFAIYGDENLLFYETVTVNYEDEKEGRAGSFLVDVTGVNTLTFVTTLSYGAGIELSDVMLAFNESGSAAERKTRLWELQEIDRNQSASAVCLYWDSYGNMYDGYERFDNNGSAIFLLDGEYTEFSGVIAAGDKTESSNSMTVQIFADDELIYEQTGITRITAPTEFSLDVTDAKLLKISAFDENDRNGSVYIFKDVVKQPAQSYPEGNDPKELQIAAEETEADDSEELQSAAEEMEADNSEELQTTAEETESTVDETEDSNSGGLLIFYQ